MTFMSTPPKSLERLLPPHVGMGPAPSGSCTGGPAGRTQKLKVP